MRFGFTVARRHIARLDAAAAGRSVDVVLRLKCAVAEADTLSRAAWKAALRAEADVLLDQLGRKLVASEAT